MPKSLDPLYIIGNFLYNMGQYFSDMPNKITTFSFGMTIRPLLNLVSGRISGVQLDIRPDIR